MSNTAILILVDESAAMESPVQENSAGIGPGTQPKSKAESVATALNSLLKRLAAIPNVDVGLVGYKLDGGGAAQIGSRWGGMLAGHDFVSTQELGNHPFKVEKRLRKTPNPAGFGPPLEQPVDFPVWYVPQLGMQAPQVQAFQYCQRALEQWQQAAGSGAAAPLLVHLFAGGSADGNPQKVVSDIWGMSFTGGSPLILQMHLSTSKTVPATLFPSNRYYLPPGPAKDLFGRSSPVPPALATALREDKVTVNPGAVCLLYNARMADIVKSLRLVEVFAKTPATVAAPSAAGPAAGVRPPPLPPRGAPIGAPPLTPPVPAAGAGERECTHLAPRDEPHAEREEYTAVPAAAEEAGTLDSLDTVAGFAGVDLEEGSADTTVGPDSTPVGERAGLVVLLLDRSVENPFDGNMQHVCARLQERANELLTSLGKLNTGCIEAAVVSYGLDFANETEVRTQFEGPLAGQELVRDSDLAGGALRVDEFETQVPNGVGGLMTIPVKKPIYVELEPTAAADARPAFARAAGLIGEWLGRHPTARVSPIVLHLTRGQGTAESLSEAAAALQQTVPASGPVHLYHLVITEAAQRSLAYPATAEELETDGLRQIFEISSPLLDRARLASEKPALVSAESKGLVVNGKFDLLLDGLRTALA